MTSLIGETVREAAEIIRSGGVVVFPTTGLYGLAAGALNRKAVDLVFEIKQRAADKPLSVIVRDRIQLESMIQRLPPAALPIMEHYWPGRVTMVFDADPELPSNLTAATSKIGVRVPQHPIAAALVEAVGGPITATSANVSGRRNCSHITDLDPEISKIADLILDAGKLAGGPGSTVVDVTLDPPQVLREGAVAAGELLAVLK